MKIKGNYLILFLLLISLLGTALYQYRKATEMQLAQEIELKMQSLLEASDIFSSNLGSVQQYFRNFVAEPSSLQASNISIHKTKADSALLHLKTIGNTEPSLKSLTMTIASKYFVERDKINTYINLPADARSTENKAIAESEAQMDFVWTSLFEYRNLVKQSVVEKSKLVRVLTADSKRMHLISIAILIGVFLSAASVIYGTKKQILSFQSDLMKQKKDSFLMLFLLDKVSKAVYVVDKEGNILYANKTFLNFIGLKLHEVLFKPFELLEGPKSFKFEKPELRRNHKLPPFKIEETIEVNGDLRYFLTRKYEIKNVDGQVFAAAVVSGDITEHVINQKGLEISRQEAEHARLTQEQFMANISHELRTPMNGIVGMASLLSDTLLTEEQSDYLDIIKQSSTNLIALIDDILDFSKIEAGMLQIEKVPFKISEVVEQTLNSLKVKAKLKNIYITCTVDHKVPVVVLGDPLRLYQIISNLLSNAIKFTTEGGVSINVSAVVFKTPAVKLIIEVRDTGIGIPEERISYIFQSFAQSSIDISRKFGGTGLGLTIVKQLIEMQGGSISVESKVDSGSCFKVIIPFETSLPESWTAEESEKFMLLQGKEVLVVEDNLINQKVILKTLENAGLITTVVDSGFSALDILKQRKFHVVIMDIQMPEMDGRETTLRVRKDLKLDLPIIAMTASVSNEDRERCLGAGMNDYIAKPFVKEDLFEKLLLYVD